MSKKLILFITIFALFITVLAVNNQAALAEPDTVEEVNDEDWFAPVEITASANGGKRPVIVKSSNGQTVVVGYLRQMSDYIDNPEDTVPYFRRSNNRGESWSSPSPIGLNGNDEALTLDLTMSGNDQVHAVWTQRADPEIKIYYAREDDWPTTPTPFSTVTDPGVIIDPAITSSSNQIVMVWGQRGAAESQTDIYFRRSTNNGNAWSGSSKIVDGGSGSLSLEPSVSVGANGIIHVIWLEGFSPLPTLIYYVRGITAGGSVNWSEPTTIASAAFPSAISSPELSVHGNSVHVSYTNWTNIDDPFTQNVEYTMCNSSCALPGNWTNPIPISGQLLGETDDNPFTVRSTILHAGSCPYVYFHGIPTGSNTQRIFGSDKCTGWSANGRDVLTASNLASTNPRAAAYYKQIYVTYENVAPGGDPEDPRLRTVRFMKNDPKYFLNLPLLGKH